jgi:hypothetical protein
MYKFETAWNQNIEKGGTPIGKRNDTTIPNLVRKICLGTIGCITIVEMNLQCVTYSSL